MSRSTATTLPKIEKAHVSHNKKHDTMEFFQLFLGCSSKNDLKLKPSVYLREMMMSTEQRIEHLNRLSSKKICTSFLGKANEQKDFKISPPVVLFQSFQLGKQYSATLTICNVSEGSKLIGIKSKPAHTFSVSYLSKVTSKLAPGISLHFLVKFMPLVDQDYSDCLVLETDSYVFEVPLAALGSRPLLNFPDFFDLRETMVKVPTRKTFYLKNVGQVTAAFNLICEKPFSAYPERCILEVGKIIIITVQLESDVLDSFFKTMLVQFETGEELCIDLSGSTKDGKVWLDSKHVCVEDTFMGLKRQKTLTLFNDTDVNVKFSWHRFSTRQEDMEEFERIKGGFEKVKDSEMNRCTLLEYNEIVTGDNHEIVYSRIMKDQLELLSPRDLYFQHEIFDIDPVEGEVWPGGRCTMTVTFSPRAVGQVACTAYCDVAAVAQRLPLNMSGLGLGPVVQLNLRSLDIGPIFLGLTQAYEIIAANKGDILCRVEHVPTQPIFGGTLTVAPQSQCLLPYEMKSFVISFCSGRTGTFVEDVLFRVVQSNEVLKIMLKGSVVNPTISFDSAKLDFGCVAVGFPKTMSVGLVNQSQVPVEFALRVPSDGNTINPPITCEQFMSTNPKPSLVHYCSEFSISPDSGVIDPNTTLNIEVTLITNTDRKHSCVMVAENKNSKLLESISLLLIYESNVATLVCDPPELILRFSFINFQYNMDFTLTNTSTLPAYFYFPPQQQFPVNTVQYETDIKEALLQPNESITINATVVPLICGRVKQHIVVLLFGSTTPTPVCSISCSVQGPNVSANVVSLEYGRMTLMEPKTLSFELSNDSPISGYFTISIEERTQSKWTVEPMTGDLGPGECVTVYVTLQMLDPGTIATALSIQVENSRVISVGLFGSASGCGITIEPNIFPEINLGYLFSRRLYQFVLNLQNPGSRHHFITFVQDRVSVSSNTAQMSLFKLIPNKLDLLGGGKAQVVLEAQSNRDVEVVECYSCLAIINKRGVKQNLGNFTIRASFTSPVVEVSEESLEFEINIGPRDNSQGRGTQKCLTIRSVASLPITVVLELNPPFLILENGECFYESVRALEPNQETEVVLEFRPPPQYSLESEVFNENLHISYKEHPQRDKVPLKGMLNFPNLDLSQHLLEFECLPLDHHEHKQIFMVNPTPLPVKFTLSFDPKYITVVYFERENIEDIVGYSLPEELIEDPLKHNSVNGEFGNKDSIVGPLPLVFVEPVASDRQISTTDRSAASQERQEDDGQVTPEERWTEVHGLLFPVVHSHFTPQRPTPEFSVLPRRPNPKPDVSQVFDLCPKKGVIPPHQSQILNVAFRPQQFMGVATTAICSIDGGPTETIRLSGQSARHLFSISTTFINFGFRVFMEPCDETIKIENLSPLPFHFKVSSTMRPLSAPHSYDVQLGCLTVEPCFGHLPAHSCTAINVRFYPGLAGEFQQQFTIQVGYLEPVNILVTGYGVVPQVAINIPHVSRPKTPINWGYQGVASLTAKRFTNIGGPSFQCDYDAVEDPDLGDDWVIVSCPQKFPSPQDIWLAVERVIAYHYITENALTLKPGDSNKKLFNQCLTPGYLLDLGSVVLGTTTNVTLLVENRGLVRCDVKLIFPMAEKKLKHLGFSVNFQNHLGLPVGKSVPMDFTIKPTSQKYASKEEPIHYTFYLQVMSGPTVPLYFKALFTVPYIVVDCTVMDFGSVQCGQCKKMCLLLKNSGAVKAEWSINLVAIKKKKQGKVLAEELIRFSVNQTLGVFEPKTAEMVEIGFLPKEETFYETVLKLEVKHNPEVVTIRLFGNGVEPKVIVSPKVVEFGTHVPYCGPIERRFSITNPCPFNVQVYFPDFDSDIINEDRILRVLTNYYKTDAMLLPLETYDKVPSFELEQFYENVRTELSTWRKMKDYNNKSLHSIGDREGGSQGEGAAEGVEERFPHISTFVRASRKSKASNIRFSSVRSVNPFQFLETMPDPFLSMTPSEVEKQLIELLNDSDIMSQLPSDPLSLEVRCRPQLLDTAQDHNKGTLNVFHGAPRSNYQFLANHSGRLLNHKVTTLDELILQEAATSDKSAAVSVQEAINTEYMDRALEQQDMELFSDMGSGVSFEELNERVNFLKSLKEPVVTVEEKKKPDKKGSRPGTAKKASNKPPPTTFHNLPEETFIQLLCDRLHAEVGKGLVFESLTGFFLKTVNAAVSVILKCVGHINSLRFITCYGTYQMYEERNLKKFEKIEMEAKQAEVERIQALNQMSSEQLELVSAEERQLYEDNLVAERRQWLQERRAKRASGAASPTTTAKTKGDDAKSKRGSPSIKPPKSADKTNKTQGTASEKASSKKKKTSSIIQDIASEKDSSKRKKTSANKSGVDRLSADEVNLKEAFEKYEIELRELVILLSRWNKDKAEFEDLDRTPSLFNIPTNKPQSRKGKKSTALSQEPRDVSDMGVDLLIISHHGAKINIDEACVHFHSNTSNSEDVMKEWWDVTIPAPLILSSVSKPDIRAPMDKEFPLRIFDYKRKKSIAVETKMEIEAEELEDELELSHGEREGESFTNRSSGSIKPGVGKTSGTSSSFENAENTSEEKTSRLTTSFENIPEEVDESISEEKVLKVSDMSIDESSEEEEVERERVFTARVELAPGEERTWSVVFVPDELGTYNQALRLEVAGWRKRYNIFMEAICDIPHVDCRPAAMFEKVNDTLNPSTISQCVYLNDIKTFYFGPVFATAANKHRTNDLTTNFYFTNTSGVHCELEFGFLISTEDNAFGFKPDKLDVSPGETKALEVFACPTVIGKYEQTLVYSMTNNARPGFVKMSCIGVKPDFEFEPKEIRFERVLLFRKEFSELTLTNKCYKPLGWRLVDVPLLSRQVSISKQSGVIPALQSTSIYINFEAEKVEIANQTITIEVFDDQFRGTPFFSEPIPVTLESVDVLVDILFPPESNETELKFQSLKVGEPESYTVLLKNKGKYDVTFSIKFNEDVKLSFKPEQVFSFTPTSGTIPKLEKTVPVKITCMCAKPVHLRRVPVFKVWLVDTGPGAQVVAAIPINVTIEAFSAKYRVSPEPELNFSSMLVGTKKVEPLIIENIGKFEFMFEILTLEQVKMEKMESLRPSKCSQSRKSTAQNSGTGSLKTERGSIKTGKETKGKETKGKEKKGKEKKESAGQTLTVGAFTLSHKGGVVQPGEMFKIDVECYTPTQGSYQEEIVIKVLEFSCMKREGTNVILKAISYLPFINFEDTHAIFKEAHIESEPNPDDGEPSITYDPDRNELYFCNACIGAPTSMNLHLHLYNSGLVPCEASATITSDTEPPVFCISPNKFTIMAHSELIASLVFQPIQIGVFREMLEVRVELPSPLKPQIFTTKLIGEASLPRITLTSPASPLKLMFPPTLVGDCSEDKITFFNSGCITCTVILEMLTDNKEVLSFYSDSKLIQGSLYPVKLRKGVSHSVVAKFTPKAVGGVAGRVRLMVTNNPYEDLTVEVEGVGYVRDIVMEGLPLVKDQVMVSSDHSVKRGSKVQRQPVKYELSLPPCSVGEFAKRVFCLKNQTENAWYRFQWAEAEHLSISPSVGHLPPASSKELLVIFQSHEPGVVIDNVEVRCSLSQIKMLNEDLVVGWDNHQKTIRWVDNTENEDEESSTVARRVVVSVEEPQYEEVPGSGLSLAAVVTACSDYPRVSCSTDDIVFPPTIINQMQERELVVCNTGLVPAQFLWQTRSQVQRPVGEAARATYGAVTMSAERPQLRLTTAHRQKVSLRPATCPRVRPGRIPLSVALLSKDDLCMRKVSSVLELKSTWPLTVEPSRGLIQPGGEARCVVRFKPLELAIYECELQFRVDNAEPDKTPLSVKVEGSSLLPCCHLVVPDCTPTCDPEMLQITFRAMGVRWPVNKCVKVVNTTQDDYTVYWRETNQDELSMFGCSKPVSVVGPTKHAEVMFSFTPRETGRYRSLWQLSIPERQVTQTVLLVGEAAQPYVTLSSYLLQLQPTLIGVRTEGKVALVNHEDCDLKFVVDQNSLHCGSWGQTVQVQPMRGVVPAQGQIYLRVALCPMLAGQGHFAVQVAVHRLDTPIKLGVEGHCYLVQPQLVYQDFNRLTHWMLADKENNIDIGVAEVRIPLTMTFSLTNIGKTVFHYNCFWSSNEAVKNRLSISAVNKAGLVGPQSKQLINIVITPLAKTVFSRVKIEIVINKGPRYSMYISGTAAQPQFKFSMNEYDFGACYVLKSENDSNCFKTDLVFSNTDEKPLLIECDFDPLPHLLVGLTQATVEARSELHIPITFLPLACQQYQETLHFLVDGSYRHDLLVTGRGIDLNVMLVQPVDKLINLEGVVVGKTKRRTVSVVNSGEAGVTVAFTLEPPVAQISLSPAQPVTLRPHQTVELSVTFAPVTVVKGIHQELALNFQSVRKVLSIVTASSVGISVKIDRDYFPFGSVAIGNTPSSKLLLTNDGDLIAKFAWQVTEPVFSIAPSEGLIAPGTNIVLNIKYAPTRVQKIVQAKGVCTLSNGEQMRITMSGSCVDLPPPSMTIPLSCPVRTTTTTHIPVFNKFGQEIELAASINGDYFSGNSMSLIPPYGTHNFEITYSPLSMTPPSQPHKGTAIFYFVDGTCLLYCLEGTATEPNVADTLVTQLVTHIPHTLSVPVHNWMQTPQKFSVSHNLISPAPSLSSYQLTYNEIFMVSGNQTRELMLKFVSHFPGNFVFKVVLTSETGDFVWYEVTMEVSDCPSLGDVRLEGRVREETLHELVFRNPVDEPVKVDCHVNVAGLTAVNTPLDLEPLQQGAVRLRYFPLWPADLLTAPLELTSAALGTFPHTVTVSAAPALPLPPLRLRCDLGHSVVDGVTLTNPTAGQATFQCSSSHEDVAVEERVVLGPGEERVGKVTFQPSSLTDVSCDIVATSSEAGELTFPVVGVVNLPEPRGPFTFTPGSSRPLPFTNVYKEKTTFVVVIDNPAFSVKKDKITLNPKEVTEINVEMTKMEDREYPAYAVTGKMSVFAEGESIAHIKWVFYLRGELLGKSETVA